MSSEIYANGQRNESINRIPVPPNKQSNLGELGQHAAPNTRRTRFSLSNVLGSPFFLTSISIALLGWFIAFFSSIAADSKSDNFSHFAWWAIMYQAAVIVGVSSTVLMGATGQYRIALCAFLASALSFTTSTTNALIYSSSKAQQAAATGHIFLSLVNITWIVYFGSEEDARIHTWMDSRHLHGGAGPSHGTQSMSHTIYPSNRFGTPYPKTVGEADITGTTPNRMMSMAGDSDVAPTKNRNTMATEVSVPPEDLRYSYRAKALYSYEANVDDPNELSFKKGEILEVADLSSKWYQAKNSRGEVGIAPSNYLVLVIDES